MEKAYRLGEVEEISAGMEQLAEVPDDIMMRRVRIRRGIRSHIPLLWRI